MFSTFKRRDWTLRRLACSSWTLVCVCVLFFWPSVAEMAYETSKPGRHCPVVGTARSPDAVSPPRLTACGGSSLVNDVPCLSA